MKILSEEHRRKISLSLTGLVKIPYQPGLIKCSRRYPPTYERCSNGKVKGEKWCPRCMGEVYRRFIHCSKLSPNYCIDLRL